MASRPRKLRWYFSLRSPYSWFAYRDLMSKHPEVLDRIEWLPFWEPDEETTRLLADEGVTLPIVAMSRAKNFYILQDTRRLATERGLSDITWPIDRDPCWEVAHLAWFAAEDAGRGKDFVAAAHRARWQEGRNISEPEVMAEIATELGLDADVLANAHKDPELRRRGAETLAESAHDGLFGVPFFIHGRDKFWGVDRVEQFVKSVGATAAPAASAEKAPDPATHADQFPVGGDQGHAGGCG
ncbi:DsbA family protein [Streptomyces sp. XM4193]|uniref:2-hydroxychromene-2-carboxylate isomerase n=1 Tax=Streptomyces tardus TaxID=2780544 RepID=A0A949JC19_9ACTN|nr:MULTISPECIES: DsbA family protein [Streptomyces]MBU7597308.1 DsbA family protein [Streptomyces tardus]MCK1795085.1 DsbA family protein [Streptomyces sp. XM4193]